MTDIVVTLEQLVKSDLLTVTLKLVFTTSLLMTILTALLPRSVNDSEQPSTHFLGHDVSGTGNLFQDETIYAPVPNSLNKYDAVFSQYTHGL